MSVIIPTIGRGSLGAAIVSAKMQSQEVLEVIVVDDSSSQSIFARGCRVVRTGGGRGVGYARNLGARSAKGDIVAFLDDDDVWLRKKIRTQIEELIRKDLDVLISSALANQKTRPAKKNLLVLGQDPLALLYSEPHIFKSRGYLPTASYIAKKTVFEKIAFREDLVDRENILFLASCYRSGYKISQSHEVLIKVNYSKKQSLRRMSLESEYLWFEYLQEINLRYAQNFIIESARNFLRRNDFISAREMLRHNKTRGFLFFITYSIACIFSSFRRSGPLLPKHVS